MQVAQARAETACAQEQLRSVGLERDNLRDQLACVKCEHAAQNKDMQAVLTEARQALQLLRTEKVRFDANADRVQ